MKNKIYDSAAAALGDILSDGQTIAVDGGSVNT